jgi:DNA-nicking Smr family endonuclease
MAHRRSSTANRPFEALDRLLVRKKIRLPETCLPDPPSRPLTDIEERQLFQDAVTDVVPLPDRQKIAVSKNRMHSRPQTTEDPDREAIRQLRRLVETGSGFVLKHTAEYAEGAGEWMPPELFRRLHGGHFSIQAHVDLHGLNLAAAEVRFDRFMQRATTTGLRAILVVHGRGRSSPGPPVLKKNLFRWLSAGRWKRWVIAYTSARACDGGTGATYVLLRSTPRSGKRRCKPD